MSKIILVSFADNRFRNSLIKLKEYTRGFPFDERYFHTQDNILSSHFWKTLKPWLYRRGYGYWCWKALIVREHMRNLQYGDMLIWSDGGIYWNNTPEAIRRFTEYIHMLDGENVLLTFQQPTLEQEYTKGDVLDAFAVYDNEHICKSLQLWAGCFMIKKTHEMMQFLDRWIDLNELSKELITDKRSVLPNKPGFKEHRHDQSIFSLLAKQYQHIELPWTEVLPEDGYWDSMNDSPIQGRRLKERDRPKSEVLKNKMLMPWRMFLNFYFRRIRDYEFSGEKYPW